MIAGLFDSEPLGNTDPMKSRSITRPQLDDRDFPLRLGVRTPAAGYGTAYNAITNWLNEQVGRDRWAWHSGGAILGGDRSYFYFRHPGDAAKFLEAFPTLQLADAVDQQGPRPQSLLPH